MSQGGDYVWPNSGCHWRHCHWRPISRSANWTFREAFPSLWCEYRKKHLTQTSSFKIVNSNFFLFSELGGEQANLHWHIQWIHRWNWEVYWDCAAPGGFWLWLQHLLDITTLLQKVPDFHMDTFLEELNEKRNELDGDVFEMLYTLSGE